MNKKIRQSPSLSPTYLLKVSFVFGKTWPRGCSFFLVVIKMPIKNVHTAASRLLVIITFFQASYGSLTSRRGARCHRRLMSSPHQSRSSNSSFVKPKRKRSLLWPRRRMQRTDIWGKKEVEKSWSEKLQKGGKWMFHKRWMFHVPGGLKNARHFQAHFSLSLSFLFSCFINY